MRTSAFMRRKKPRYHRLIGTPSPSILRPFPTLIYIRTGVYDVAPPRSAEAMTEAMPPETPPRRLVHLAREFLITVALAFLCLLALLHTIQYHIRLLLGESAPCETCAPCVRLSLEIAALAPLAVLKITTICALMVFMCIEVTERIAARFGLARSRVQDVEARGELWTDVKMAVLRP
jgi:hypothetical protein